MNKSKLAYIKMSFLYDNVLDMFDEVDSYAEENVQAWFVDLICMPKQNEQAQIVANTVLEKIEKQNPFLAKDCMVVAITNDGNNLPAKKRMNMLIKMLKGKENNNGRTDTKTA